MADSRGTGLQTIFGFFLGLMVTAFIGVGVYTFYPPADRDFRERIQTLHRQQEQIQLGKAPDDLTPEDRAQVQDLQRQINAVQDESQATVGPWEQRTSIILIVLATATMAVSLLRAVQLPVISNGLLLGGVFTMVYGIGWSIATESSASRFFVMAAALAITLGLGYVRFVRQRDVGAGRVTPDEAVPTHGSVTDLERRVQRLEDKMNRAAGVLGNSDR